MVVSRSKLMRVFSAHAEVVPGVTAVVLSVLCILRARGGSSTIGLDSGALCKYSPRTRR